MRIAKLLISLLIAGVFCAEGDNRREGDERGEAHSLRIYGNTSLGYYYANIYVGTPPQKQSVVLDTGSGQLALPCTLCDYCGTAHIDPLFDISRSATARKITCAQAQEEGLIACWIQCLLGAPTCAF